MKQDTPTERRFTNSMGMQEHVARAHYFRVLKAHTAMDKAQTDRTHAAWGFSHACASGNSEAKELANEYRTETRKAFEAAMDAYDLAVSKSYYAERELQRAALSQVNQ